MDEPSGIRLNKFLATQLSLGRRAADDLIAQGKVLINGKKALLGSRAHPGDDIKVNGWPLQAEAREFTYLLMNKPKGYICSRRQQGDTPTIYELIPKNLHHLKTVGRLDKDSSGLILLTNNGDIAHQLTHPSFTKIKKYEITLSAPLAPLHHQMINDSGITLPDGPSRLQLERLKDGDDTKWRVTMHEGRNRQIRRTFQALGYEVTRLHRTHFGPFDISELHGEQLKTIPPEKLLV